MTDASRMGMRAVIIALVLAASVVGAEPREEHGGRVLYSQKDQPRGWVPLATPTPTKFGTETIVVGRDAGKFRTLRIDRVAGTVHLLRIRVDFSDGRQSLYNVTRYLTASDRSSYVDFGGAREIEQIAITTARFPDGTYALYGRAPTPAPRSELIARR